MSTLHITSGDVAGDVLQQSGIPGDILVWHDILYDGPRKPGWPDSDTLAARSSFIEQVTGYGLKQKEILSTFQHQYALLAEAGSYDHIVLWFDACLFDQSMLAHVLACLYHKDITNAELLCVDSFPGIEPFHGLGQLQPDQMASLHDRRLPVTGHQYQCAVSVDKALAEQNLQVLTEISGSTDFPLPWVPAAVGRWLQEQPDPQTGLGRLETLALHAVLGGCETPPEIFTSAAAADTPPQYWGDITLWAVINGLAEKKPPLVHIAGPVDRLPQWKSDIRLADFTVTARKDHPVCVILLKEM